MTFFESPFDPAEFHDPTTIRAIVEVGRGKRSGKSLSPHFAGSYAAVIWGRGTRLGVWGCACAKQDDTLRAMAVSHLLSRCRGEAHLIVRSKGLEGQLNNVSRSRQGETRGGAKFDGYEFLKPVQEARERGEWTLIPFKKGEEPEGHHLSRGLAEATLKRAQAWQPLLSHYPHNHVLETSENPDPDDLLSRLSGGGVHVLGSTAVLQEATEEAPPRPGREKWDKTRPTRQDAYAARRLQADLKGRPYDGGRDD